MVRNLCTAAVPGQIISDVNFQLLMSRCGLVVRRQAGKQKDLSLICFGCPLLSCGLWILSN